MPSFLFLTVGQTADLDATDAQTAAYNEKWAAWIRDLAARGSLEAGAPLDGSGSVVGKHGVTELTLQEPDIGGFLVVKADSLDQALSIAASAPHIPLGGTTIVRPCVSMVP
jgi:hypothetical protein